MNFNKYEEAFFNQLALVEDTPFRGELANRGVQFAKDILTDTILKDCAEITISEDTPSDVPDIKQYYTTAQLTPSTMSINYDLGTFDKVVLKKEEFNLKNYLTSVARCNQTVNDTVLNHIRSFPIKSITVDFNKVLASNFSKIIIVGNSTIDESFGLNINPSNSNVKYVGKILNTQVYHCNKISPNNMYCIDTSTADKVFKYVVKHPLTIHASNLVHVAGIHTQHGNLLVRLVKCPQS